jgi:hypothetical protein
MKKILIGVLALSLFIPIPANSDNANPPRIIDLIQLTKGPYQPGDLVTFKISYTGGNPGLDNVSIIFSGCDNKFRLRWYESQGVIDKHGNGVVSMAMPTCSPGIIYPTYVEIVDKTTLIDSRQLQRLANLEVEISDYIYKPVRSGEIPPTVLQSHSLDLSIIPSNPKIGDSYLLPAKTSVGMPVYYRVGRSSPCSITRDEPYTFEMPGGILKITGNGDCNVSIQSHNGSEINQRPSFAAPTISTKGSINLISSSTASVLYEIKMESKPEVSKKMTITCVKGKTVKKVTAVNPKCPKGYTKK